MLQLFVCEDNLKQREKLEKIIKNYIMIEDLDINIALSTDNPDEILDFVQEKSVISGLYFLDIDLNHEMNGIELAVKLRMIDPTGKIVFITTHGELAFLTFQHKVEALDYMIKEATLDEMKSKIAHCIQISYNRQLSRKEVKQQHFIIKIADKTNVIPLDKIMFFETSTTRNRIVLYLDDGELQFKGTMKEIENYNPTFVRVHHAIVANKQNIEHIDNKKMEIKFVNGQKCMVSVRKMNMLENALR